MSNEEYMEIATNEAEINAKNNFVNGGPFGAVIVKDGKIISRAHNTVLESKDATAHAEVNAIREASRVLNTHDLSGCTLYASSEPCPMCLSAIIWANIKDVYYANTKEDAENIGFRDDVIYEYIKGNNKIINVSRVNIPSAKNAFESFKNNSKNIY